MVLLGFHTSIVDQGIESAESGLHVIKYALNRFVVLDVDLHGPDFTASRWDLLHDSIGRFLGFD